MRNPVNILMCLVLTAALMLSGCGSPAAQSGGQENVVSVTDQAGRQVIIEGTVERIVSGYYISSSACIALGLSDKLAGIEAKAASRPVYALAAPRLLKLPDVGTAKEFNLESCIALEPDLVILPLRLRDSADAMAELGIPVILINPESHEGLVDMVGLIGKAAGVNANAERLINYYNEELGVISGLTGGLTKKPSVYMGGNSKYLSTAPNGMYQSALIEASGGVNAAAALDGDSWVDVSYEQLLAMNPDVIVIPAEASYDSKDIYSDAQLAELTAVKEKKIYQFPRDFEAWDSPVPSCTLGARWMLSILHEDIYPIESLRTDAAAFYKEFYNAEINTDLIGK